MSKDLQFRCDVQTARCMQQAIVTRNDAPWVTMRLGAGGFETADIHVCPGCLPALANFLPGVPRETIGAFAQHERTIDVVLPEGARIVGDRSVTLSEEMTTTFHTRGIEIENASQWMIEAFSIGHNIQSKRGAGKPLGEMSGEEFVAMVPDLAPFDIAPPGVAIAFRVRYIGGNPEGGVWRAKLHGIAAGFPEEGVTA